jgi:hypothetical protein
MGGVLKQRRTREVRVHRGAERLTPGEHVVPGDPSFSQLGTTRGA